jgi:hypothetical protein
VTDQPLSSRAHPSPDELADLRADALEAERTAEVSAHVVACPSCSDELAAMAEVEILLAEAGHAPIAMPADVAASLDAALARASLEREAGVPSLEEKRAERIAAVPVRSGASRMSKLIPALGAAAAVVVIAGIAYNLGTNQGADDSTAASDSAGQAPEAASASGGSGGDHDKSPTEVGKGGTNGLYRISPQKVTRNNLRDYASALAAAPTAAFQDPHAAATGDTARVCPPVKLSEAKRRTPVQFEGDLAFVVVKTEAREATVYTCESPPERLYSTTY